MYDFNVSFKEVLLYVVNIKVQKTLLSICVKFTATIYA